MDNIVFSRHADLKISQRKIPRLLIRQTVMAPDLERPVWRSRVERYRKFGNKHLKVIVKREKTTTVVITAHWVAKVKGLS